METVGPQSSVSQRGQQAELVSRERWVQSLNGLAVGRTVKARGWSGTWKVRRILESDCGVSTVAPYELEAVREPWDHDGSPVLIWQAKSSLSEVDGVVEPG